MQPIITDRQERLANHAASSTDERPLMSANFCLSLKQRYVLFARLQGLY